MVKRVTLGETEQRLLLALWRLGEDAAGAEVQAELEDCIGLQLSLSAIHYTLLRLEDKGHVSSHMGSPQPVRGGKARRIFRLLPQGKTALRREKQALNALWEGLEETP
ncbi:MAG TPA: BlaI/MecI/CopY family transcriptional regulator [Acidobacteriota bacterium]|nr:BlaI/MecI/CopY family transcriptional regulator [Acidobacteriota bacterium]